jgi:hypothetical protein
MTILWTILFVAADEPTYRRDVAPILAKHCTICHDDQSLDDPETSGGLSLESYERVIGRKDRPLLHPKKPADSAILQRLIAKDVKKRMPKDEPSLSEKEIDVIRRWIGAGAPLGEATSDAAYHRRETGRKGALRELVVKFDVTVPAKAFGQSSPGVLSLAAPVQPLALMTAVTASPDGSLLATGGHRRIVIWNLKKAAVDYQFTDPIGMTSALGFSPDATTLYVAGGESGLQGELRAYDLKAGRLVYEIRLSNDVLTGLAVHPDGKRIALSGMDRKIRLFDVAERREVWSNRGHSDFAWSVAFSKDGRKLVSTGKDKSVKVWNTETGTVEQTLTGHRDEVLSAVFSPDGTSVLSGGKEPRVAVTKLGPAGRATMVGGHGVALHQFAWNVGFSKLASAGADRTVRIWRSNGTTERTLQGAGDVIHACALSRDGKAAFGAAGDGVVYVWSVDAGRIVARLYVGDPGSGTIGPWIACAANGSVSCSHELAENVHWIIGTQEAPFDRTPESLRRTESVVDALGGSATLKPLLTVPEAPKKIPPKKTPAVPRKFAALDAGAI